MNKSNFVHGLGALGFQLAVGLPALALGYGPLPLLLAGAGASGFWVGVEWMQQVRVNLAAEGRPWPTVMSPMDALRGFRWTSADRYGDCGVAIALCSLASGLLPRLF